MAKDLITLSNLAPKPGSKKDKKRVGRGSSSGMGKTASRGTKGARARSGYSLGAGFEGGQNPLHRRLPKRGFTNAMFAKHYVSLNVSEFEELDNGTVVSYDDLVALRVIRSKAKDGLKILGHGELTKKLTFKVQAVTESAKAKIEKAGGTVEVIGDRVKTAK